MFTTEHRPADLPNLAGADSARRQKVRNPSRDEDGNLLLPNGATTLAWYYAGPTGGTIKVKYPVPVTDAGERTHVEWACPQCPNSGQWMSAKATVKPLCTAHQIPLREVKARPSASVKSTPVVPWRTAGKSQKERGYVAAATAGLLAAGVATDVADFPWYGDVAQLAAIPACIAGSWWLTRAYLTRQAIEKGTLDATDDVTGVRTRRLIGRRARCAAYITGLAGVWVELADAINLNPGTVDGALGIAAALGVGIVGSKPYRDWVDDRKARARQAIWEDLEDPIDTTPQPTEQELLVAYVQDRWQRVAGPRRVLNGTTLEGIQPSVGGWSATIVAHEDSDLDPEKFDMPEPVRKIARAYNVGASMVSIIADPFDANRAMILVQRTSPLSAGRNWDGAGIDPEAGSAETMTLQDGTRGRHQFWRPGWGAVMELIAGCTGSGKSEYLNLLLALERKSGRVISWVGDPQMGQSLGDVRDGVDWFAPTNGEILLMLRTAAQVMLARNVLVSRMRTVEYRANGQKIERRVKYVEVSPAFPLLSVTIDEAHIPMNDPDVGKQVVKILALIAKSGRKANVKVRLLVQSPLLTELKDSVLRGQLASGLVTVFRTADRLTGPAAWPGGKMPGDPSALPDKWEDATSTAGLGYSSGTTRMRMRTDYAGDLYDVMHEGETLGLEPAVLGAAGVIYAERWKRLEAFDNMDPAELLGAGIPEGLLSGGPDDESKPAGGGKEAVLRFFAERWLDDDRDAVPFGDIAAAVRDVVKTRACTNACNRLVEDQYLANEAGAYRLTEAGAEQLGILEEVDA